MENTILEQLNLPQDLAHLSLEQDREICAALRAKIIETTGQTGGHLGSNLGVVELTLALLKQFDFRRDRLIWDVGHQCYPYKILTGRLEKFSTLRQENGLSGFPKREESLYDHFNTGHSSTSISAALGYARAAKLQGRDMTSVVVIGDGAMTGGMVWEALNNIREDDNILIVLNDNQMSIAPNVGRLSQHFEHIRVSPKYLQLKPVVEQRLRKVPLIGRTLVRLVAKIKTASRRALHPIHSIFDALGLRYYGPIDGHDLESLNRYFYSLAQLKTPRILHVSTLKGKGYTPAEQSPADYHGVSPKFVQYDEERSKGRGEQATHQVKKMATEAENSAKTTAYPGHHLPSLSEEAELMAASTAYTEAFARSLIFVSEKNPQVCAISAAMLSGTGLNEYEKYFPSRCFDVGIAEQHALTFAAGLACAGMKPVVAVYATFLQRAYDQLIHDCCLQNLPVTLCLDRAGLVGPDGETHQGIFDIASLLPLPNLRLYAPYDYASLNHCLQEATKSEAGVAVIRYPKGKTSLSTAFSETIGPERIFDPQIIKRGDSMTVVAVGNELGRALEAAADLQKQDSSFSLQIVSVLQLKPLSIEALAEAILPNRPLLFLEEGSLIGSWSSWAASGLQKNSHFYPAVEIKALPDCLIEQASISQSLAAFDLDMQGIVRTCQKLLQN